jgi:uncharacterized protein (DUF1697 family)
VAGYVALLRGINVGGHNKLPMASLRSIGEDLGLKHVGTYINSGNLLFSNTPDADLESRLEDAILEQHQIDIPVVICSSERLEKAIAENPYPTAEPKLVLVYFCTAAPSSEAIASIDQGRFKSEKLEVNDSQLFLQVPDGAHKTKLTLAYLEKTLGVTMTSRNINSVKKLRSLTSQLPG